MSYKKLLGNYDFEIFNVFGLGALRIDPRDSRPLFNIAFKTKAQRHFSKEN